jgi:dihydrofolate synthase/folylpolyglutamate synthase
MSCSEIEFLYSLEKFGIKLGLQNSVALLNYLCNPEKKFQSIHVAGTNGKGSLSSFVASILYEYGYKVGHYTSPHLERFNERIKINGAEIETTKISEYVSEIKNFVIDNKCTFFETTTAIAFKYFSDSIVDFAVIETGLGGRLDSTNVITPIISVITSISYDHIKQLGNSIESIAEEKAGIIKCEIPCVTGVSDKTALKVIQNTCKEKGSEFYDVNEIFELKDYRITYDGMKVSFTDDREYNLVSPIMGSHQIKNIMCAVQIVKLLCEQGKLNYDYDKITLGIKNVCHNTGLSCRFEVFSKNPQVILDVAHNLNAIETLVENVKLFKKGKLFLIFGIMEDKDYEHVINKLSEIADVVLPCKPNLKRALDVNIISKLFADNNVEIINENDLRNAIDYAIAKASESDTILITGSHYVCGEIISYLKLKYLDKN